MNEDRTMASRSMSCITLTSSVFVWYASLADGGEGEDWEEEAVEGQQSCIARVGIVNRANTESKFNCQCEWLMNWHDNE